MADIAASVLELIELKLGVDWSAARFTRFVDRPRLAALLDGGRFAALTPPTKARLLLALLLAPPAQLEGCRAEAEALLDAAAADRSEWVSLLAAAARPAGGGAAGAAAAAAPRGGPHPPPPGSAAAAALGRLPAAAKALEELAAAAGAPCGAAARGWLPGEEALLLAGGGPLPEPRHAHFRPREGSAYATSEIRAAVLAAIEAREAAAAAGGNGGGPDGGGGEPSPKRPRIE